MNAHEALQEALVSGPLDAEGEVAVATDPQTAFQYALFVLKAPFPEGEAVMATETQVAFQYSLFVLKAPFPEGEAVIAVEPQAAIQYAIKVLQDEFTLGEDHILGSECAQDYIDFVGTLPPLDKEPIKEPADKVSAGQV